MKQVTILIPCYNEESNIEALYAVLLRLMESQTAYTWQLLFVDDGSQDGTLAAIKCLRSKDSRVCYIALSRNFGKERAMLAGFDHATGDCMVIIDADLQHPPSLIADMLVQWEQGYHDVYAKRDNRGKESFVRHQLTALYYKILDKSTQFDVLQNVGDFRLLDRRCIDAIRSMRETQRYTKGLFAWIGYKKKEITFNQQSRLAGKSSWNLFKLTNLAIDGLTSFTITPLRISTVIGLFCALAAILYMTYIFFKTALFGDPVQGYPTIVILILFLGGMQLFALGIIGEYLGRIFYETKHRPAYLIEEMEGVAETEKQT